MTTQNGNTLLEILARDMASWQSDSNDVCQNSVGQLFSHGGYRSNRSFEKASDWTSANVKEDQWQEARTAYLASQNKPEQEVAPAKPIGHRYAQALQWLAEGKEVQVQFGAEPRLWMPLKERPDHILAEVLLGRGGFEFRLAPKTIKVGARTIEAPLMDLKEGDEFWWCESTDRAIKEVFKDAPEFHYQMRNGRCYATERAAIEADAAITALLTGKE